MIFCVEDDESIQSLELYALRSAGFEVRGFVDGDAFLEALRAETPELVILDVMLPGKSGVELLKQMKASGSTCEIPIIMATAKGAEYDKIQSLGLGADDYLVKPFGMMEMVSRVKAVLRRCYPRQNQEILAANDLVIDLVEHTVMAGGERISLTYRLNGNTICIGQHNNSTSGSNSIGRFCGKGGGSLGNPCNGSCIVYSGNARLVYGISEGAIRRVFRGKYGFQRYRLGRCYYQLSIGKFDCRRLNMGNLYGAFCGAAFGVGGRDSG